MTLLWVIQFVLDVLLLVMIFYVWRQQTSQKSTLLAEWGRLIKQYQDRAGEYEAQSQMQKEKLQSQLKTLSEVCERAKRQFKQGPQTQAYFPTEEEQDLKNLSAPKADQIPSMKEIQTRKEKIRAQKGVDLRTLLNGELS